MGTDFLLAFMPNDSDQLAQVVELHLTSDVATTATVLYPSESPTFSATVEVDPSSITVVSLPAASANAWQADTIDNNAVRVTSANDVVAYMINRDFFTSDAAMGIPVDALRDEYLVIGYPSIVLGAQFVVFATEDDTVVTITPTVDLVGGRLAEMPFSVTLDAGEGYYGLTAATGASVTGTEVVADRPVGLTNGSYCANVPGATDFCDHMFEMAHPVQTWGNAVVAANLPQRPGGSVYRVVASTDDTEITFDGVSVATLDRGEFYETPPIPSDHLIEGSAPIFACQYMTGNSSPGATDGDPAQGNLIPVSQYRSDYRFSTIGGNQFGTQYLTIVVAAADIGVATLDGDVISSEEFTAIGTSGFWVARILLDEGSHATASALPHTITVEGYNFFNSYVYPGGAALTTTTSPPTCGPGFAVGVQSYEQGIYPDSDNANPKSFLGDDDSSYFNTGGGGNIVVTFSGHVSTSGDSRPDLCILENGGNDCYYIGYEPADTHTLEAIVAAGWSQEGQFWRSNELHCGNVTFDIDALVPGSSEGELLFRAIKILDDDSSTTSNGSELISIEAKFVCGELPPIDRSCVPSFATGVQSSLQGTYAESGNSDPDNFLGDNTSYYSTGGGGDIVVTFPGHVSTSGDDQPDLVISEDSDNDCYYIRYRPANVLTQNAIFAAGWSQTGYFWESGELYCGGVTLDIDALVPGFAEGELEFSAIMILDDASSSTSNGAELLSIEAKFVCSPCEPSFATGVQSSLQRANAESENSDPSNFLGDNSSYFSAGSGGNIVVTFPGYVSTSGDSRPDLCVWEDDNNDCYYICYQPADVYTRNALDAAGWSQTGELGQFWERNDAYCGDMALDIDSLAPGFGEGQLKFSAIMILDDASSSTSNGAELVAIEAKFVCEEPPPFRKVCDPSFATGVQSSLQGTYAESSNADPDNFLGNNTSYFSTGGGGEIVVTFPGYVSTSGDDQPDLVVREDSNNDCYYIRYQPANTSTQDAIVAAGWSQTGQFWGPGALYCGGVTLDIDALVPGFGEGELEFSAIMILDDASSSTSNGSELVSIEAKFVCGPCAPSFATGVQSSYQGANFESENSDPSSSLGDDFSYFSTGSGGNIVVTFPGNVSNSGDSRPDLCIWEDGGNDCYYIYVQPADTYTQDALNAAGWLQTGEMGQFWGRDYYYCGDVALDIDTLVPGFSEGGLKFSAVMILDDDSSATSDGSEVVSIEAKFVCMP